jgi:phage baseplate assembly protein W
MTVIKIPFTISDSGLVGTTTDADVAVQQRIIDVLTTSVGERVMKPTYGANARLLLFEPVDALFFGEFRMDALNELSRSLSGVTIQDLSVQPASSSEFDDYATTLTISVRYQIGPFQKSSFSFLIGNPNTLTEESPL